MELSDIEKNLASDDMHDRLKAIKELKGYNEEIAIPLLLKVKKDDKFLVRSFVARELGNQKTAESFATLLEMMKLDRDTNVRAEASNSLSLFGEISIPHLQQAFLQDEAWLVRLSILAVLTELNCPEILLEVCNCGLQAEDLSVKENTLSCLASLVNSNQHQEALELLLTMINDDSWRIRSKVAQSLTKFPDEIAKEALNRLKKDSDHRVVATILDANQ
jgi:HEAT repeat protein